MLHPKDTFLYTVVYLFMLYAISSTINGAVMQYRTTIRSVVNEEGTMCGRDTN